MNRNTIKIMTLGDSITQAENGQNSYRQALWEQLTVAGYNVDFVGSENKNKDNNNFEDRSFDPDHEGHWGWRIDEIINGRGGEGKLSDWLTGYTPDVVLIHLGTNDAIQNNSAITSIEELNQVIDILREDNPDVTIFLSQLIPARGSGTNSRIDDLNSLIPGIVADKNQANSPVILVDQNSGFNANTDTYDGVHPNDVGEAKMAQRWFDALKDYLDPVVIDPPQNNPQAIDDSATTNEDTQLSINVLANDSDEDGDNLTVSSVNPGNNGSSAIINNQIVYTPQANFNGVDSFSYEINDGNGGIDTATVTVNVAPVNDLPVANNDTATTNSDTGVSINVLANDTDVDGDNLTVASITPGSNGNTTIIDNQIVYIPESNFTGEDSFTYSIDDGNGGTNTAQVSVTVIDSGSNNSNNNPSARVSAGLLALYNFDEGSGNTVFDVSGVGTALNLEINNPARVNWGNGVLNLNSPSLIASVETADKLIDGITATGEITLEAWVTPENRSQNGPARIATLSSDVANRNFTLGQAADDYNVRLRTTTTGNNGVGETVSSQGGLLSTELTHVIYTREADGDAFLYIDNNLVASENIDGDFSNWDENYRLGLGNELNGYRPWLGSLDLFAVYNQAFDASEVQQNFLAGAEDSPSLVTPTPTGYIPVAVNDSIVINEDTQINIDVLANDSDEDGDNLTVSSVNPGNNGVTAIVDNQIVYTPAANFNGIDSFSYEIDDGNGGIDTATVTVNVESVNDLPFLQNDTATTNEDTPRSIDVLANDSDVDGDNLTISSVNPGNNGTTQIVDNQIIYTPEANFIGEDNFTYFVDDGNGITSSGEVSVKVTESGSNSNPGARVNTGLLALYNFDEGSGDTVFDVSGVGTALNLEIDDLTGVNWGDGVLNINSPSLIASNGAADKIIDGITATQEITMEAWVTPGNRSQNGPARIATLSSDIGNRNFTLGQAGDDYNVRLRTTTTGYNGVRETVSSQGGLLNTELTHVIYTRASDGEASLYIDSQLVASETIDGDFSNWDENYRLGLGNEFNNGDRPWLGSLDMFAVYNQAFEASEVEQNFLVGSDWS